MNHEAVSRPPSPSRRTYHHVPVAVLASRWHFDYEHYAQVMRVRAELGPVDAVAGPAVARQPVPVVEEPSTLERLWSRAIESLRFRRRVARPAVAALPRAS
jgi:hypothetical protein